MNEWMNGWHDRIISSVSMDLVTIVVDCSVHLSHPILCSLSHSLSHNVCCPVPMTDGSTWSFQLSVSEPTNQVEGGRLRFIYFDHLYGTFDHHRHVSSMYWYPIDTHLRLYRPIHLTICPRAQTQILRFFTSSMSEIRQHHARRLRIIIYGFLIGKMPPNKTRKKKRHNKILFVLIFFVTFVVCCPAYQMLPPFHDWLNWLWLLSNSFQFISLNMWQRPYQS